MLFSQYCKLFHRKQGPVFIIYRGQEQALPPTPSPFFRLHPSYSLLSAVFKNYLPL